MTLPSSGPISLSQVNTELGIAAATVISMDQANVRNLAQVASGAISMANLYGKSNIQQVVFDNGAAMWGTPQDWNLWDIFVYLGIAVTSQKVRVILTNITINASATSIPALETGSGWPAGTLLEVIMGSGCVVMGKGGAGGAGSTGQAYAAAGGAGGPGYRVTAAISGGSITTTLSGGLVYGGGGGGGGGGGITYTYYGGTDTGTVSVDATGGTGGTGAGPAGQTAGTAGQTNGTWYAGAGGTGGTYGAAGNGGGGGYSNYGTSRPGAGGAGGAAIVNASLSTNVGWVANSNYFGAVA